MKCRKESSTTRRVRLGSLLDPASRKLGDKFTASSQRAEKMLAHRYPHQSSKESDSANMPVKHRGAQGLERSSGAKPTARPELHRQKLGALDTPEKSNC